MTIINTENVKKLYYANLLYEIHKVQEKSDFLNQI